MRGAGGHVQWAEDTHMGQAGRGRHDLLRRGGGEGGSRADATMETRGRGRDEVAGGTRGHTYEGHRGVGQARVDAAAAAAAAAAARRGRVANARVVLALFVQARAGVDTESAKLGLVSEGEVRASPPPTESH